MTKFVGTCLMSNTRVVKEALVTFKGRYVVLERKFKQICCNINGGNNTNSEINILFALTE